MQSHVSCMWKLQAEIRSKSALSVALCESLWLKCGVRNGLHLLFGAINTLFQAANNHEVIREPIQLTHAFEQYNVRKHRTV